MKAEFKKKIQNQGENGLLLELNLGWNHLRKKGALAIAKGNKTML
jgi:hypothetical protein